MHIHHLPGSGLQMWRSSHSHSCERCVPWSGPSQLNITQTSSWWFHAADYIFDGLTSNRSSVWSNLFPSRDLSHAVSRLKSPNWGIHKAINHRLLSPELTQVFSYCLLVHLFLLMATAFKGTRKSKPFIPKGTFCRFLLSHPHLNGTSCLLWMENQMWGWNETIFILLAFPLLVIHHSDWKEWAQWSMQDRDDGVLLGYTWGFISPRDKSKAWSPPSLFFMSPLNIVWKSFLPFAPAPGLYNTSLQHLWFLAHSNGSACWEAAGPELSPRPRCSSLYPRISAAANTRENL